MSFRGGEPVIVNACHRCPVGLMTCTGSFYEHQKEKYFYEYTCRNVPCSATELREYKFPLKKFVGEIVDEGKATDVEVGESQRNLMINQEAVISKYRAAARRELKPFCENCACFDFKRRQLKNREDYSKLSLLNIKETMYSGKDASMQGKPIGAQFFFECQDGHGVCFTVNNAERLKMKPLEDKYQKGLEGKGGD